MDIYTIKHTKRSEYMKIWRILSGLSNIMTDSPDYLINVHDINAHLMKFVVMKAWPLTDIDIEKEQPHLHEEFDKMWKAYQEHEWEQMGKYLANIALIQHEYERKVLGDEGVKKEDER